MEIKHLIPHLFCWQSSYVFLKQPHQLALDKYINKKIVPILGQKCNYKSLEKVGALTFSITSCILFF